jgi:hypothetical protein
MTGQTTPEEQLVILENDLAKALNINAITPLAAMVEMVEKIRMERDNLKAVMGEVADWAQETNVKLPVGLLSRILLNTTKGRQFLGRLVRTMSGKKGEE